MAIRIRPAQRNSNSFLLIILAVTATISYPPPSYSKSAGEILSDYDRLSEKVRRDEAPKTYDDLLDPKWKGRMSLDQTDMHLFGTLLEYWGREKGLSYFRKLAENDPSMRRGKTLQAQILGAGEVHVAPWLYGYRPLAMKGEGAPVDISLLKPVL